MADITAADIKKVREITGAGMSDVKAALTEAEGDHDKAIEILRLKGAKDVGKRESRSASNGFVAIALEGTTKAVLVEVSCETDFVAKTEQLQTLGADIAQHALSAGIGDAETLAGSSFGGGTVQSALDEANAALGEKIEIRRIAAVEGAYVTSYLHKTSPDLPPAIGVLVALSADNPELGKQLAQHIAAFASRFRTREEVPAETVEAERRLAEQMAREEGKPEAALPKIVEGRVNSFFKDFVLLEQAFVMDNKKSVQQVLTEAGVEVTAFARFKVGQP
ncbi:MAG TPA: translation elongation factor Ts [Mycobacteriales bacterium]|nr:translation elongation factor Ts [Mycobacteriales bacterium]